MTSIAYIIPYFGKFPKFFPVWLESCRRNPTVDWLIFTDDVTPYDYPQNVKVKICSFSQLRERVASLLDFPINLPTPYKLCDYKVTYGLLFEEELKGYDYWGFCDIDLIWGDIRHFFTEALFAKYDKVGYQGHSTLFRNTPYINHLFLEPLGSETFQTLVQSEKNEFIDEDFINRLCDAKGIATFKEPIFANLSSFVHNFKLNHLRPEYKPRNKRFIFSYENGKLFRLAAVKNKVFKDEYLYVHFLKRNIDIEIDAKKEQYLIVPNKLIDYKDVNADYIISADAPHAVRFAIQHFKENAYKLNWRTIIPIFVKKVKGYYRLLTKY